MAKREIADKIIDNFLTWHSNCSIPRNLLRQLCYDAMELYKRVQTALDFDAFITNRLNIGVICAKQRSEEINKKRSEPMTSTIDWDEVKKCWEEGVGKAELIARFGLKEGTLSYHTTRWRKTEVPVNEQEDIVPTVPKLALTYVNAYLDVPAFLSTLISDGEVIASNASNAGAYTSVTYKLQDGSVVNVTIHKEDK